VVNDTDNVRPISVTPITTRLIEKVLATRLSLILFRNKVINKAQYAYSIGGSIDDPVDNLTAVWSHAARTKNNCFNIFYDISKAYDTVQWHRIEQSLKRIQAPQSFIDFVMNSLTGTESAIKINPTHRTAFVQAEKAIRQGSPLAPLLFVILMDPLHEHLPSLGKYRFEGSNISTNGYADDTHILADNAKDLKNMHSWMVDFLHYHHMAINTTKSIYTAKTYDNSAIGRIGHIDPKTNKQVWLKTHKTNEAVRYLGLWINMDLTWDRMISKMNATIWLCVNALDPTTTTYWQTAMAIKQVIHPRLALGLKFATIPRHTLDRWDRLLMSNLATAGYLHKNISRVAMRTITAIPTLDHQTTIEQGMALLVSTNSSLPATPYNSFLVKEAIAHLTFLKNNNNDAPIRIKKD
jgi:hypothetical protein